MRGPLTAVIDDTRELWRVEDVSCWMISCCSGAELQLRRGEDEILARELYPSKSDLYERATQLRVQMQRSAPPPSER